MKVRPRIQREFLRWLAEVGHRLPCPATLISRDDRHLVMQLGVAEPHLFVHLSRHETSVGVDWEGQGWDYLYDDDVSPERITSGYVCSLCEPDQRETFASRAALWREHLFKPWLAWLNRALPDADALLVYGKDGVSWARLGPMPLENDDLQHLVGVVPFRRSSDTCGPMDSPSAAASEARVADEDHP